MQGETSCLGLPETILILALKVLHWGKTEMIGHSKHGTKGEHTLVSFAYWSLQGTEKKWGPWGTIGRKGLEEAWDPPDILNSRGRAAHAHTLHLASCALCSSCPDSLAQGSS